mmetsp:Transcript_55114/g.124053  ORF Transcript_55114/g.124053 Transcript_55114/m.124053 type:complete len:203 (+) Transcript_55114:258-866(+)
MMTKLQTKYAEKPVRFVLIPVNQFGGQEPKANAVIKSFAEKSVRLATAGAGSNVIMLAKSNLNDVKCTYAGPDACMPSSTECCPANDAVYDDLLASTSPGTIAWNFDKIVTGLDGKPYRGEKIMDGTVLEDQLSAIIDSLLAEGRGAATDMAALRGAGGLAAVPWFVAMAVAVLLAVFVTRPSGWSWSRGGVASGDYINIAA